MRGSRDINYKVANWSRILVQISGFLLKGGKLFPKKNTNIKYLETKTFFIDNCQKNKILAARKTHFFIIIENINKLRNHSWVLERYCCDIM